MVTKTDPASERVGRRQGGPCQRGSWRCVAAALALMALAAPARGDGAGPPPTGAVGRAVYAIAPGSEALITAMLGGDDVLPGGCRWSGAEVKQSFVVGHYQCATAGQVDLELHHPSEASEAAVRTAHLAIVRSAGNPAPQRLIDAVAERVRARESAWRWVEVSQSKGETLSPRRAKPTVMVILGAVLVGLLVFGWVALAWRSWRRDKAARTWGEAAREWLWGALLGVLGGAAALGVLRGLGDALSTVLRGGGVGVVLPFVQAMGCAMALPLVWFVWERRPGSRPAACALVLVPVLLGAARYAGQLAEPSEHGARFGSLATLTPSNTFVEDSPLRPHVTYHTNRHGFRGPDWSYERAPGVTRVVLVGDSFVFGSGVEQQDTLSEQLRRDLEGRHPERRYEVLNLGIPGDNLGSHVESYREASALLHPDAVVLCLTSQNDLTQSDDQDLRRWLGRPSALSAAAFFFGKQAAQAVWWDLTLITSVGPADLRFLDDQLAELVRWRADGGAPLWIFPFAPPDGELSAHLTARPGIAIIPGVPGKPEYFIPGDGHPTALGNQHFAAQLAASLDGKLP